MHRSMFAAPGSATDWNCEIDAFRWLLYKGEAEQDRSASVADDRVRKAPCCFGGTGDERRALGGPSGFARGSCDALI